MTENEIIKALEWCFQLRLCVDCPMRTEGYFSHSGNACRSALMKNALDLINRQKAEIERLNGAVQEWVDGKCLSQKHLLMIGKLQNEIEQAKSKAIKEFAERLKANVEGDINRVYMLGSGSVGHLCKFKDDIDNLVKEMTEGK